MMDVPELPNLPTLDDAKQALANTLVRLVADEGSDAEIVLVDWEGKPWEVLVRLKQRADLHEETASDSAANRPMTDMPEFQLNLSRGSNDTPLILTCSIVGDSAGVRAVTRTFQTADELKLELARVGISADRYDQILSLGDEVRNGPIKVDLNEAQKLSVVQTDSTE
jgi:hypothetical protein